ATWSETYGPVLFGYHKDADNDFRILILHRREDSLSWSKSRFEEKSTCHRLLARNIDGKVYLAKAVTDPTIRDEQPFQVSTAIFSKGQTQFDPSSLLVDSLNFDFGRNAKKEPGLYVLFSPRAYFQTPSSFVKVFQDTGNKGTKKGQNIMMWKPETNGAQKLFGYYAEGGGYHDGPPKYDAGNIRLAARVLEDPSNSGLVPPVAKKITAWKKVYDTHGTDTSDYMDFSLLQPDLSNSNFKDYYPLGCIGLKNMDPRPEHYPEIYCLHRDHAVKGTFYDLTSGENETLYADNREEGNKLGIWYTGDCGGKKKCTSVSHIRPGDGQKGFDIGAFWAREGIDDVNDDDLKAAFCPATQPISNSLILFKRLNVSGFLDGGAPWEFERITRAFQGIALAVLNRAGQASQIFVCTADGAICKVSEPDSKGLRQLTAVPVHEKVDFIACQVEQGNNGGYHIFGTTPDHHLFQSAVAKGEMLGTMLPLFEQEERVSGFDTFVDADDNCGAFCLLQIKDAPPSLKFLLHDGHSGNWTIQPLHASNLQPQLQEIRTYSVQVTVLDPNDFPWANRSLRIWTEESAMIKVNGISHYAGPDFPVTVKSAQDGRCRISIPTNTLFAPVLHVHADFMDDEKEFLTISPNADVQLKLKNLERDGGLSAAMKNPLHGNPEPLFGADKASNLDQVSQYLSKSMQLLPDLDYAADLRYLRLNREIPDQPNPKTAARSKPKTFGRLAPPPNMRFGLKIENGRATFLSGDEALAPHAMAKSVSESFMGAWGDVWHFVKQAGTAIQEGFSIVIETLADGIRATLNFVIKGVTYAYNGVANLVQEVFGMVEGVFSAIGAAFEDLVAWLGYLFDWDDILRTQRALEAVTNRSLVLLKESLGVLKENVRDSMVGAKNSMDEAFKALLEKVGNERTSIAQVNANQKASPTSDSVMGQNIVFNGMVDNAHLAPAQQAPSGENIFAEILDSLSRELSAFADSSELQNLLQALKDPDTTPQTFVDVALPAIFRAIQAILDTAFDIAMTLLIALLDKLIGVIGNILDILNAEWKIPLVSELYQSITGGGKLTFLNLACLIVAVPATPIYKLAIGRSPFPDEAAIEGFIKTLKPSGIDEYLEEVNAAQVKQYEPVTRDLLLIAQGMTTFFSILPEAVLAAAPPPWSPSNVGQKSNYLTPFSWITTVLSILNHAASIPPSMMRHNQLYIDFSPVSQMGRANLIWCLKWIKHGVNTYSLSSSGYRFSETGNAAAIGWMLFGVADIGFNLYKQVQSEEQTLLDWLDCLGRTLGDLPSVFAFLKTRTFIAIDPPGSSLVVYAGIQATSRAASVGVTFTRWAIHIHEEKKSQF
ncbi:MAG: hypothetical protein RLZZ519_176, partial [Bacteroidota bacterium]